MTCTRCQAPNALEYVLELREKDNPDESRNCYASENVKPLCAKCVEWVSDNLRTYLGALRNER